MKTAPFRAFWFATFFLLFLLATAFHSESAFAQVSASPYSAFDCPTFEENAGDAEISESEFASKVADAENYVGPSDFLLDRAGTFFYIAEEGTRKIRRVRADGTANAELISLPFAPNKLRFFPDETRLAVVGGAENGRLAIVEIAANETAVASDSSPAPTPVPMKIIKEIAVGSAPSDVAVKRDENGTELAYVADRFGGKIVEINVATGSAARSWDVGREPFCIELTPDGRRLAVANRLTDKKANVMFSCASVRVVDLVEGTVAQTDLRNGLNLLQEMVLSPDGKFAFISAVQGNYPSVTSQVSGGWIAENIFIVVDVEKCEFVEEFFLDDEQLGAANPWGIAISDDGERLVLSLAGTDELVFLPFQKILKMLNDRPDWARPGYGAYMYSSFAKGEIQLPIRMRVNFGFKGLRQVIARGNDVYALAYFDDVICKTTLKLEPPYEYYPNSFVARETPPRLLAAKQAELTAEQNAKTVVSDAPAAEKAAKKARIAAEADAEADEFAKFAAESVANFSVLEKANPSDASQPRREEKTNAGNVGAPLRFVDLEPRRPLKGVEFSRSFARLAPKPVWTNRRRGEAIFHDGTFCFEHWQSCVTCHPDARADGFNWDLLNDGTGNLKNTKSMLLSHETPPAMISGIRADAETAVRAGFTHILFTNATERDACAVDEYLSSLKPFPSPYLVDGKLSESAERGKILFESDRTGCAICHPEPLFTDLRLHKVGSQDANDYINAFDSPTLIEVWRTAPYLNTGAFTTVRDLLLEGKHGVRDGRLDKLTPQEQDDLIEYVLSL